MLTQAEGILSIHSSNKQREA